MKKNARVVLMGTTTFPPMNVSHVTKRRSAALQKVVQTVLHHEPSMLYVCPTRGVNLQILPLLLIYEIPIALIFPSQHFLVNLTQEEKMILEAACSKATKIIILDDTPSTPMTWASEWHKATKQGIDSSDWVMLVKDEDDDNYGFDELLFKFEGCTKPVLAVDLAEEMA